MTKTKGTNAKMKKKKLTTQILDLLLQHTERVQEIRNCLDGFLCKKKNPPSAKKKTVSPMISKKVSKKKKKKIVHAPGRKRPFRRGPALRRGP
jgi:hypothetical protein